MDKKTEREREIEIEREGEDLDKTTFPCLMLSYIKYAISYMTFKEKEIF